MFAGLAIRCCKVYRKKGFGQLSAIAAAAAAAGRRRQRLCLPCLLHQVWLGVAGNVVGLEGDVRELGGSRLQGVW